MKILFVTLAPFSGSGSGMIRNKALIQGICSLGHDVDVLTVGSNKLQVSDNSSLSNRIKIFYAGENKMYNQLSHQNSQTVSGLGLRMEKTIRYIAHKIYPWDYTMGIANNIKLNCLPNAEYDLVISSSNPYSAHRAVKKLINSGLRTKHWIQYWGDPLSNDVSRTNIVPEFILKRLEFNLLKSADEIVFVSPLTLSYEKKTHRRLKQKMKWLPIPYLKGTMPVSGTHISYLGDYYTKNRNIMPLYNALKKYGKPAVIAGDGDCILRPTDNLEIYSRCDVKPLVEKTRISVVLLNEHGTQIPGKLYHCAGSFVPILVICDGSIVDDVKQYFSKYDKFYFCENNVDSIISSLVVIDENYKLTEPIPDFSPEIISRAFLEQK